LFDLSQGGLKNEEVKRKVKGEKKKTGCIDFSQGDILYYLL
jgi:hypothetical protein